MHHRKKVKSLGRVARKRRALMKSLAVSLIKSGKIKTTLTKAKALRPYIEKAVSRAGKEDIAVIRRLRRDFNMETVELLMRKWAPLFRNRKGGYMRISKLMVRVSDASPMAYIEFVEQPKEPEVKKKVKRSAAKKAKINKLKAKLDE
ncbi:MAG: 50S ribosomal protein L17 [Candidatus Moraniibacteriota bacterium]